MRITMDMLLKESVNYHGRDLVIVDIQPSYERYINFNIADFIKWLNDNSYKFNKIYFLFNGEEFGLDSWDAINHWYIENGMDEVKVYGEEFEKNYGFFRDMMDSQVDDEVIVKIGKYMLNNGYNDIRDISDETFNILMGDDLVDNDYYTFYIPDVVDILESANNPVLVGGGSNECLAEIELLFQMLDIDYELEYNWVY